MKDTFVEEEEDYYNITFDIPIVSKENILVIADKTQVRAVVSNKKIKIKMKDVNEDINLKDVVLDKTIVLENLDYKKMSWEYSNGVLEVNIPKMES